MKPIFSILIFFSINLFGEDFSDIVQKIDKKISYSIIKVKIKKIKSKIDINKTTEESLSILFTEILVDKIIPYWYGTEWSFEGHTTIPKKGYIACGYFVSTTLKHIGFNLNRYKYAQQSGMIGAKTLQMGLPIKKFYPKEGIDISKTLVASLKPGLYQVGLSYHVGYLLIRNNEAYFIHSNYLYSGVMLERAADSEAFVSGIYVISDISFNDKLIEKWILNDEIVIIHD